VGVDYFIMKQLALTTEARLVVAPDADVNRSVGIRYFSIELVGMC